jgi:hypothetical protein
VPPRTRNDRTQDCLCARCSSGSSFLVVGRTAAAAMAKARCNPFRLPNLLLAAWSLLNGGGGGFGNAAVAADEPGSSTPSLGLGGTLSSSSNAGTESRKIERRSGIRRWLEMDDDGSSSNSTGGEIHVDFNFDELFGPSTANTSTSKSFNASSVKEKLLINNFISRSGVSTCQRNLFAADSDADGKLDREEYAEFIRLESGGEIDRSFGNSGAVFVALYYVVACNQCYDLTGNDQCCVGDDAVIVLPQQGDGQDQGQWVLFLCSSVEEAIEDEIGVQPTPAPTQPNNEEPTPAPAAGLPTAPEEPSGAPVPAPSREPSSPVEPTDTPQSEPTGLPTSEPTKKTRAPVVSPTLTPSDEPTSEPSGRPTSPPSESPTTSPIATEAPSSAPTASPQAGPTPAPVAATTESPSLEPSDAPVTEAPSDVPATSSPSDAPSAAPVTEAPSGVPTESPVAVGTGAPTLAPNAESTSSPVTPTGNDTLCVQFFYSLKNTAGLSANDIMDEVNNTLKTGLELATRNITIGILNATFPASASSASRALEAVMDKRRSPSQPSGVDGAEFSSAVTLPTTASLLSGHDAIYKGLSFDFGDDGAASILDSLFLALYSRNDRLLTRARRSQLSVSAVPEYSVRRQRRARRRPQSITRHVAEEPLSQQDHAKRRQTQWRQQRSRRLVYYTDVLPPTVTDVVDDSFCTGQGSGENNTAVRCAFVSTEVCVVLEAGDDPDAIEKAIDDGFRIAILDGSFFGAIPADNVP